MPVNKALQPQLAGFLQESLDLLEALRRRRKITKSKGPRKHRGDQSGADILGEILGDPFFLDKGGSLGQGEEDNPFNPTMDTPLGDNPNNKP